MPNKIQEIILEPTNINVGSLFKLKVKAIRYMTYNELKTKTYSELTEFTYKELKGE